MGAAPQVHILSDLHLLAPSEPFYQRILQWMDRVPVAGDHVALAGDIFDVFVGNKAVFCSTHSPFFKAVKALLAREVRVYHIEGNHDFWLQGAYAAASGEGVHVASEFVEIELEGKRLRIEHGDLADSTDRFYLLLRSFFKSGVGKFLVDSSPGILLHHLGHAWSNGSRDRQPELPDAWSEEKRSRLRQTYFEYAKSRLGPGKADSLVMGHCHDAHESPGYMNLGFPRKHQAWVRWTPESNRLERVPFAGVI
jgi:UDP-2,3-diacylglucosamine pyrophosphatase LpxH